MKTTALSAEVLQKMHAYWRAANYLSVGQIYLYDNPLLKRPLAPGDVKRMLLGHWGTTPGQNFVYVHLNRVIKKYDLDMIYVSGPGHGGPAVVGNTYLEGTYSEVYPNISQDEAGLRKLFLQFSFPGGIPSHASPECPGSIHEPAPQRLQDLQSDHPGPHRARGTGAAAPRLRMDPALRGGSGARPDARGHGRGARQGRGADQTDPAGRPCAWPLRASPLADDRAQFTQGLDGAQGRRRPANRGHVPSAPGAAPPEHPSRTPPAVGGLAEKLPARGALRRAGPVETGTGRTGAQGRPPHGRESPRQRRHAVARPPDAGFP